jgi:hypothetical protein
MMRRVRADHHVDRLRREARRSQIVEEGRAHHVEGLASPAVLVVADAGVDQRGEAGRLHDEGVDRLQEAALLVEKVRRQPRTMALDRLRCGVRQEPRRPRRPRPLDDGGDAHAAHRERVHTAR